MFGNDENKKTGRPVRGYRWMFFTFFMIGILCIIVMFHDQFEEYKNSVIEKTKKELENIKNQITGTPAGTDPNAANKPAGTDANAANKPAADPNAANKPAGTDANAANKPATGGSPSGGNPGTAEKQ